MKMSRRALLSSSVIAALYGATRPSMALASSGQAPWRNWSGALMCHPVARVSPTTEAELAEFFANSSGPVRPVGSGHSFSPLVPTDGHLVVLDQMTGLLKHDADALTATFAAGTRLGDIGNVLNNIDQAMFNLPDIDRQTLAGAASTGTHGTGIDFKSLSGYVTQLRLISPAGEQLDITPADKDLFNAARVSVGALGVITEMTLQNRTPYRLKQSSWIMKTSEALSQFDQQAANHRHFELFPLTHSDYSIALATDETDEPINNPTASPEEEAAFDDAMRGWMLVPPEQRKPLVNGLAEMIEPSSRVDVSHRILANVRNNRFNEMEYSVPISAGAECLQEVLRTIEQKRIDVVFPLEYRYVAPDDTWLSMSSGDEGHAAISIHRIATEDYRPYFDVIEPIFWKYHGRPHWGKVHSLEATELLALYPEFGRFQALREKLDPQGRMLNDHLRKLFGVKS
jgi:FAD-linked oxidoreductase